MPKIFVIAAISAAALSLPAFAQQAGFRADAGGTHDVSMTSRSPSRPVLDPARRAWFGQAVGNILAGPPDSGRSVTLAPTTH